jgi:hypothetical protein
MAGLVDMSSQFKGLPMTDLIGSPLDAACKSQIKLANATADFIKVVGFMPNPDDPSKLGDTRTASFKFQRPVQSGTEAGADGELGKIEHEEVEIEVPLLSIVNVPNLSIQSVDITFDMEVKSSTSSKESVDKEFGFEAEASIGWGWFSASMSAHGSVASHKENTRSSDNSAKYHVEVHAADRGMPEGLSRVMDILQTAAAPKSVKKADGGGGGN